MIKGLVAILKRQGGAVIYDWMPGKRTVGLLVVVVIECRYWNWIMWLFLILWVVGGGKGIDNVLLLAGRKKNQRCGLVSLDGD